MTEFQFIEANSPAFKAILETACKQAASTAIEEASRILKAQKDSDWVRGGRAMQILGVGKTKFYAICKAGEIECTDTRRPMYKTKSLYSYLERNKR